MSISKIVNTSNISGKCPGKFPTKKISKFCNPIYLWAMREFTNFHSILGLISTCNVKSEARLARDIV